MATPFIRAQNNLTTKWWEESEDRRAGAIFAHVNHIDSQQTYRLKDNVRYTSLYRGLQIRGLDGREYAQTSALIEDPLKINLVHNLCNTANSKIAKNKPRIIFLTDGGNWRQRYRAKLLTKAVNGVFDLCDVYPKMQQAQLDSTIQDLGVVKLFLDGQGNVCAERVFSGEIRVDDIEAIDGVPRTLHQVKRLDRDVVKAMFPDEVEFIDSAQPHAVTRHTARASSLEPDMIDVIETWHLPSGPDADDGRHAIAIENKVLFEGEWDKQYFPFVFQRWTLAQRGFYGQGLASQLAPIQSEVDHLTKIIKEHTDLATGFVAVEKGSDVSGADVEHNTTMRIIEYDNIMPAVITPQPVNSQYVALLQFYIQQAFEVTGISQLTAKSLKPAGLDSGAALREFSDIETERFQMVAQRYEQSFVEASLIVFDLLEDKAKRFGDFKISAPGTEFAQDIDWSKARLDREQFITKVQPTSFLPSTPAGKLGTITELVGAGFIGREEAMQLLDYPDLKSVTASMTAAVEIVDKLIADMLDPEDPKFVPPDPFMDLQLAVRKGREAYQLARQHGAPEENLELVRRFIVEAQRLLQQAQAAIPQPAPQAPPGEAPLGGRSTNLG